MTFSLTHLASYLPDLPCPALDALQVISATALAKQYYPHHDPAQPALILGLTADRLPHIQHTLAQAYPPEHPLIAFTPSGKQDLTLAELGGLPEIEACFMPPRPKPSAYAELQDIAARLRAPDGCPWDRALTWEKLRSSLLEEAYELLAALDAGDPGKVLEEQGDLLLQIALQAQIATEAGHFRLPEVIAHIVEKLIRRHPHVFGDAQVNNEAEVLANWEAIKAAERAQNGEKRSPLAGVPAGLPALAQAEAYLDRMSRLRPAAAPPAPGARLAHLPPDATPTTEQVGETLFELVAWALAHGIEAEAALRQVNARFAAQVAAEGWG